MQSWRSCLDRPNRRRDRTGTGGRDEAAAEVDVNAGVVAVANEDGVKNEYLLGPIGGCAG